MTENDASIVSKPLLVGAEPQLFVADVRASSGFYAEKLGFQVVFLHGDPPYYGQVRRDGVALNLRCVDQPLFDQDLRERDQLLSAVINLDEPEGLEELYREFQAAGVSFQQSLMRQSWGALTFVVRDPDGNLLLFAGPQD